MNDADRQSLNKRIALRSGWEPAESRYEHYRYGHWKNDWRHESSNGGYVYSHDGPPDFTREWKHAGPLLVELVDAGDTWTLLGPFFLAKIGTQYSQAHGIGRYSAATRSP